jgi:hypothetical protein
VRSIKAIVIGSVFIVVVMLLLQLAFIFIVVGYNALADDFPFLNDITGLFRYLVGIPVFMVTMFAGGYITAYIANMQTSIKVWLHCLAVGVITVGGMMYLAMDYSNLTLTGIVVTVLALSASSAGGFYWLRDNRINQLH